MRVLVAVLVAFVLLGCAPSAAQPSAARREVTLLHIADLHSHLFPDRVTLSAADVVHHLGALRGDTVSVGGAARLAAVLDAERARADVAVTLDAGDVFEGTAVYTLFGGVPEMRAVDALGVDADALGNHDFTPGFDRLAMLRRYAPQSALVAANLVDEAPGLVVPSVVVERGGLRIRVIGLGRSPDGAPDVGACAAEVQRAVDADRGSDVVVVLSHLGSELDAALVPLTTGIDVVLGGHTHDVVFPPRAVDDCGRALASRRGCRPRSVFIVHSGAYGRYLGRLVVSVATNAGDVAGGRRSVVTGVEPSLLPITESFEERADVLELLEPYRRAMDAAGLDRPIAFAPNAVSRATVGGGDSALGDFVTHAMRTAAGADVALINSTGIRDDLAAGRLTVEDVFRVLPFDDELVMADLSGQALLDVFERIRIDSCARDGVSQVQLDGATVVFACAGRGAASVRVGGKRVEPGGTYRVATASFLTGAGQWLDLDRDAATPFSTQGLIRDAIIATLRALPACADRGGDAGPSLGCLDASAGAERDGRIGWE